MKFDMAVAWWAVAAMFTTGHFLPELMAYTEARGAFVNAALFAPVVIYAVWRGDLRRLFRPEIAVLTLLFLWTAVTGLWSEHGIDAAVYGFCLVVTLAFAALFMARPQFLLECSTAATVASVASLVLVMTTTANLLELGFFLPMIAVLGPIAVSGQLPQRSWAMIPLVVLSTFRAATIGILLGAALLRLRSALGWVVVSLAAIAVTAVLIDASGSHPTGVGVERTDIVGRFVTLVDDGGSHRADLWSELARDANARTTESTLFGHTIGDAGYYVASVFPLVAFPGRGEWVASTHNTLIEFIVADGLIAIPLILLALLQIVRHVRITEPSGVIAVSIGIVALTGVAVYDIAGGCAGVGLMMSAMVAKPGTVVGRRTPELSSHRRVGRPMRVA